MQKMKYQSITTKKMKKVEKAEIIEIEEMKEITETQKEILEETYTNT